DDDPQPLDPATRRATPGAAGAGGRRGAAGARVGAAQRAGARRGATWGGVRRAARRPALPAVPIRRLAGVVAAGAHAGPAGHNRRAKSPGGRRAAAAAAAGTDTSRIRVDTAGRTKFVGRERSQPQLNPEISATGDVRAYGYSPGVQRDNFDAREFEVGFQSPLDPYSSTKIFVS